VSSLIFSPLDLRYKKDIPASLSEESFLKAQVLVEKNYLQGLAEAGIAPKVDSAKIDKALEGLGFDEIEEIEKRTQHATRALVEAIQQRLRQNQMPELAEWVHVGITSFDTVDTAYRLRLKNFYTNDHLPEIQKLKKTLLQLAKKYENTKQVGRTHGQWAVPSYFGLVFAECHERLKMVEQSLTQDLGNLNGQYSGAVGAYQALGVLLENPVEFEKKLLNKLGLIQNLGSTQIIPPEDMVRLAQTEFNLCAIVAKMANDLRHLARSEIAEIAEGLSPGQVGSSTMPQKRNPWNLEHICSLFKVLQSKLQLLEIDMVSEHQRDLTNSASGRFYIEFFCVAHLMIKRLVSVLNRIECFPESMESHLSRAGSSVYAEALYVCLTQNKITDSHDKVRECSREAEKSKKDLLSVLQERSLMPNSVKSLKELENKVLSGPAQKLRAILAKNGY
jgi:adenylosuccinate lyase